MALAVASLKSSLENQWLVPDGQSFPASASESGDRFATAVATWFAGAMAGAFPCSTALARKSQLASLAGAALSSRVAATAGNLLALGVSLYVLGQSFGAGVATMPIAQTAAGAMFGAVFTDTSSGLSQKAQQIASGCNLIAVSTIVVFPAPLPPLPVT